MSSAAARAMPGGGRRRRRLPEIQPVDRLLSPSKLTNAPGAPPLRPVPHYGTATGGPMRGSPGSAQGKSGEATQQGARVTRRLSPHSEHTPYSRTNPPARAIRVAARCPVDGSIPTARPRHRSQKNRPRWASRNAATLSLAIITGGPGTAGTAPRGSYWRAVRLYRPPSPPGRTDSRNVWSSTPTSVPSRPARRKGLPSARRSRP